MRKNLLIALALSSVLGFAQSGENCSYGIGSDKISNGENITTGGTYEYSAASDFDVAPGKILTAKQLTFNVLKGSANLNFVNVYILKENQGVPGEVIQTFTNLVPTSQVLDYQSTLENMDAYKITVDFPSPFDLPKGKYFVQLQAAPGDNTPVSWEITDQNTRKLGRFDFTKFDTDPWFGGFSYYDHVFEVIGNCNDTSEQQPTGTPFTAGNFGDSHEAGVRMIWTSLADDFVVPDGQKLTFTKFKISTLQLGNIKNATINIRKSENDLPGEILHTFENVGPTTENFYGYHPVQGFPLDVVAADVEFDWSQPVDLLPGRYFIEIIAAPFPFTDYQSWEVTPNSGSDLDSVVSFDGGETWESNAGYNYVFEISGFLNPYLAVNEVGKNQVSVFPNPVSNELNISSIQNVDKVFIYNAAGQTIKTITEVKNNKIDVSNLSKGIYFVNTVLKNGESKTFKVIKH
ncbi:T9SS type A sorting domain-containing protein [Epilithonimonas zeae]|uniref:Por secretion system C-terminal sorting domain-containing protein n=1 Tax=Epilithonimonas zeae TaxID=1416779 RepID=A0A1N6EBT0_9FLAO|nr:T9SS type A sorting domain-containing protein [Epilithonimonas zeae]SIN80463.1 Por secretion system C-terminal sorting domain-containing protein [Epilithonimonas zeae]